MKTERERAMGKLELVRGLKPPCPCAPFPLPDMSLSFFNEVYGTRTAYGSICMTIMRRRRPVATS